MKKLDDNRNAHPTKKGPGRIHGHKVPHGKPPVKSAGAGRGFLQHHADPKKVERRRAIALIGRRQYLKDAKFERRAQAALG